MPLKIFAEIPIDIDKSFNFVITNPQDGDKTSSALVVEGYFELKNNSELVRRILENSQVHPDFDAYMNDIIRCSKREISKDENVSVGLSEEYRLVSFQVNAFDDPHVEGLERVKFECVVENMEEGSNFLWFSFHGKVLETGSHTPLQHHVIRLNCDVNEPSKKITAEFTPSNHTLIDSELFSAIYNTVMDVSDKRSDVISKGDSFDEYTEFLNPNKSVMYSWSDHIMQCVLKRIGGDYIVELTDEELERFEVRLEVVSYSGGIKSGRRTLEGLDGILCTSDKYRLLVENETREVLLFQEMIPKALSKYADKIKTRFVVYYDYEKVGWSDWKEIRVTDKRIGSVPGKNIKEKEKEKRDMTDSIWKRFWNSIFGTNDVEERKIIESSLYEELEEIGAILVDDKVVLAQAGVVMDEKITEERNNKLNDPQEADQNFVGDTNQMIEMFILIWKSMTFGSRNHQLLPDILKLNKETPE